MEQRRVGASDVLAWLAVKATGVRGATAQPAEGQADRDVSTSAAAHRFCSDELCKHRVHDSHLLEFSGLLSGILKSLLVGMGGTRASLGSWGPREGSLGLFV